MGCLAFKTIMRFIVKASMNITFLSNARRVPLHFQESRAMNRKKTYNIVISILTQIELKSFLGIMGRYLLIFVDVAFYRTGLRMLYVSHQNRP